MVDADVAITVDVAAGEAGKYLLYLSYCFASVEEALVTSSEDAVTINEIKIAAYGQQFNF